MKKVFALLLFIGSSFFAHAQDKKPTKEETIEFIKRTTLATRGVVYQFWQIEESIFSYDTYETKVLDGASFRIETYSFIKWQNLIGTTSRRAENGVVAFVILFSSKVKNITKSNSNSSSDGIGYTDQVHIYIPNDKIESIRKAFLRLAEIAKEENKDPFAN